MAAWNALARPLFSAPAGRQSQIISIARSASSRSASSLLTSCRSHYIAANRPFRGSLCRRRWNSSSSPAPTPNPPPPQPTKGGSFLERFLAPRPMPPRNTPRWYAEMALLCTVFGITGSSTMLLVRPAVANGLGLQGSFKDGPWSYRICSLVVMTPVYATLLVVVGTVFGRHAYFRHFSVKMFSRFGIPPELMDKNFHQNAKNFKKW